MTVEHARAADPIVQAPFLLTERRPTRAQTQLALWVAALLLIAFAASLSFARVQLPGTEVAMPAYATAIFITDVLTAALLLALFSAQPTPAVLCLAVGYLVVGLFAVPWALTFPGAFTERGLLDPGQQTTAVIAAIRRCGFPIFVLAYALLRGVSFPQRAMSFWSNWRSVAGAVIIVVVAVIAITAFILSRDEDMPTLMAGRMEASSLWSYVAGAAVALYVAACVALLRGPRSVLDIWLLVVMFALLIEIVLLSFISSGRLSLGWWAGRGFGLAAASVVLLQMMWETTALYAHHLRSIVSERRASEMRLASLEALSASIAHEVNQPLASMVTNADAGILWLDRPEPELKECKAALARIVAEGHRAGKVIEGVRTLFRKDARERVVVDINDVVSEMLPEIRRYARFARAALQVDLAEGLPPVVGNVVQIQQVVSNLAANAVEAMNEMADRPGMLVVRTAAHGSAEVLLSVTDTGRGLGDVAIEKLFEPFATTKPAGLGMGLMICCSIVEAHGGRIWAAPNGSSGTTFNVALPIGDVEAPRSAAGR